MHIGVLADTQRVTVTPISSGTPLVGAYCILCMKWSISKSSRIMIMILNNYLSISLISKMRSQDYKFLNSVSRI